MANTMEPKIPIAKILKAIWVGVMIVLGCIITLPTLQKDNVPVDEVYAAFGKALYALLPLYLLGLLYRKFCKTVTAKIIFAAIILGLGILAYVTSVQKQHENSLVKTQLNIVNKQTEEANKLYMENADQLNKKIKENNLDSVLVLEKLASPVESSRSRERLKSLHKLLNERTALLNHFKNAKLEIINKSQLPKQYKDKMIETTTASLVEQTTPIEEIFLAQKKAVDATEKILNLFDNNRQDITVKAGKVIFRNNEQLDEYNKQLAQIKKTSEDETIAMKKIALIQAKINKK